MQTNEIAGFENYIKDSSGEVLNASQIKALAQAAEMRFSKNLEKNKSGRFDWVFFVLQGFAFASFVIVVLLSMGGLQGNGLERSTEMLSLSDQQIIETTKAIDQDLNAIENELANADLELQALLEL